MAVNNGTERVRQRERWVRELKEKYSGTTIGVVELESLRPEALNSATRLELERGEVIALAIKKGVLIRREAGKYEVVNTRAVSESNKPGSAPVKNEASAHALSTVLVAQRIVVRRELLLAIPYERGQWATGQIRRSSDLLMQYTVGALTAYLHELLKQGVVERIGDKKLFRLTKKGRAEWTNVRSETRLEVTQPSSSTQPQTQQVQDMAEPTVNAVELAKRAIVYADKVLKLKESRAALFVIYVRYGLQKEFVVGDLVDGLGLLGFLNRGSLSASLNAYSKKNEELGRGEARGTFKLVKEQDRWRVNKEKLVDAYLAEQRGLRVATVAVEEEEVAADASTEETTLSSAPAEVVVTPSVPETPLEAVVTTPVATAVEESSNSVLNILLAALYEGHVKAALNAAGISEKQHGPVLISLGHMLGQ